MIDFADQIKVLNTNKLKNLGKIEESEELNYKLMKDKREKSNF